jgi:hypothetical protein
VIKYFSGFGHFRGLVQSYEDSYFSVLYTDGDSEEVDMFELKDLLSLSLPLKRGQRRRGRAKGQGALESSHPKSSSKVGEKYQASIQPYLGREVVDNTTFDEYSELLWQPSDNDELPSQVPMMCVYVLIVVSSIRSISLFEDELCCVSLYRQCKRLKRCEVTESDRPPRPRYQENEVLSALVRSNFDEKEAAVFLEESNPEIPEWTQVDHFSPSHVCFVSSVSPLLFLSPKCPPSHFGQFY